MSRYPSPQSMMFSRLCRIFQTRHGSEIVCVSVITKIITKVAARGSKKRLIRASLEVLVFFLLLATSGHDLESWGEKIPSSYRVEILGQRDVAAAQFCMNGHGATSTLFWETRMIQLSQCSRMRFRGFQGRAGHSQGSH